jgi:alpha-galactosidase
MRRRKIAYIGASYKFVHQSVRDFLLFGGMDDTDLALYDIDPETLRIERDVIRRMIRQRKGGLTVTACKSRRQALEGADYVVVSVLVGGMGVAEREDQICQAHGIRHTVGDTVGPMCTARCLRMVPLLLDIAADMERFCPGAPMLSVTNPMAVLTNAVNRRTRIRCIGICHGTHFRQQQIAEAYGVDRAAVSLNVVGVNHLGFIDRVSIGGRDLDTAAVARKITALAAKGHADVAGYQDTDQWANLFARRHGVIPNNGDHHFTEFFRWFLTPAAFRGGKNVYGLDSALHNPDARRKTRIWYRDTISNWAHGKKPIPDMEKFSSEHLHDIIFGLEGRFGDRIQRELHLNVTNGRAVPNLPADANLELTCHCGADGCRPVDNAPLPPFLLGILMPLVCANLLSEKAAAERDFTAFQEALTLDPLVTDFRSIPKLAKALWDVNVPYRKPVK